MDEAAGQPFGPGQPVRFVDQGGVEVDPDEFDVRAERDGGREPADQIAEPAADVDQPQRPGVTARADRGEQRAQHVRQALADAQLLAEPLQFGVHADHQPVHGDRVENAVRAGRQRGDDTGRAPVTTLDEPPHHGGPADRQPRSAGRIRVGDQVGYLKVGHGREP